VFKGSLHIACDIGQHKGRHNLDCDCFPKSAVVFSRVLWLGGPETEAASSNPAKEQQITKG